MKTHGTSFNVVVHTRTFTIYMFNYYVVICTYLCVCKYHNIWVRLITFGCIIRAWICGLFRNCPFVDYVCDQFNPFPIYRVTLLHLLIIFALCSFILSCYRAVYFIKMKIHLMVWLLYIYIYKYIRYISINYYILYFRTYFFDTRDSNSIQI